MMYLRYWLGCSGFLVVVVEVQPGSAAAVPLVSVVVAAAVQVVLAVVDMEVVADEPVCIVVGRHHSRMYRIVVGSTGPVPSYLHCSPRYSTNCRLLCSRSCSPNHCTPIRHTILNPAERFVVSGLPV